MDKDEANLGAVTAAKLWRLLPSLCLGCRSPFSLFLRDLLRLLQLPSPSSSTPGPTSTATALRCIPVPFPEVWSAGSAGSPGARAARQFPSGSILGTLPRPQRVALNMLAALLDWLRSKDSGPAESGAFYLRELSSEEVASFERFARYLQGWDDLGLIDCESLGRGSAAGRGAVGQLSRLETDAAKLRVAIDPYCPPDWHPGRWAKAASHGRDPLTVVVGTLRGSALTEFLPLRADRVAFFGRPSFDPEPFLKGLTLDIFKSPSAFRVVPDRAPPRVRMRSSRREFLRLCQKLHDSRRLIVYPAADSDPGRRVAIHVVYKDLEHDRLILDARPPNSMEVAVNQWAQHLGSAAMILEIFLAPEECLQISASDLRDMYHVFVVPPDRAKRNTFMPELHIDEVAALGVEPAAPSGTTRFVAALNTQSMGDHNGVEFAQAAHLAVAARCGALRREDLLSNSAPAPRGPLYSGIMIDDFIALERVRPGAPPQAPDRFKDLLAAYSDVNLTAHPGKLEQQATQSTKWGVHIDGATGYVRTPPERALFLASLTAEVVKLGLSTAALLESLVGSWVALFMQRRRCLCLLDLVYDALRGRDPTDVLQLSPLLREELMTLVVVAPVALTELRARPSSHLYMTDASSHTIASCRCPLPPAIAQELVRYTCRRGRWARLLAPAARWQREHGLLEPTCELPAGNADPGHEVWQGVLASLSFGDVLTQKVRRRDHINVSEVRSTLLAESQHAACQPLSRPIEGTDSRVGLACFTKGRSSSPALNAELRSGLPTILMAALYPSHFWERSERNPCDDPTRDRPLRRPSAPLPKWWGDAALGDYSALDAAYPLGYTTGAPEFEDLLEDVQVVRASSARLDHRQALRYQRRLRQASAQEDQQRPAAACSLPPASPASAQQPLPQALATHQHQQPQATPRTAAALPAPPVGPAAQPPQQRPRQALVSSDAAQPPPQTLSEPPPPPPPSTRAATTGSSSSCTTPTPSTPPQFIEPQTDVAALSGLPASRFLRPKGSRRDSAWTPTGPGVLCLFSGSKRWASRMLERGAPWVLCYELLDDPIGQDLACKKVQAEVEALLLKGAFMQLGAGPVCSSFSTAITPPCRT